MREELWKKLYLALIVLLITANCIAYWSKEKPVSVVETEREEIIEKINKPKENKAVAPQAYQLRDLVADLKMCSQSSDFEQLLRQHLQLKHPWTIDANGVEYFYKEWSKVSPVDAINGISLLPDDFRGRQLRGKALKQMNDAYAQCSVQVLEVANLLNNDEKRSVMSSVIRKMSAKDNDPQKALAYVTEHHGLGTLRDHLLSSVFDEWCNHDPAAAKKAASSLPYPEERAGALRNIASKVEFLEQQRKLMREAGIIE